MKAEIEQTLRKAEELLSEEELNQFFKRIEWEIEREERTRKKDLEDDLKIPNLLSFLRSKDITLSAKEGEIVAENGLEGYILKISAPSKTSLKLKPDENGVSFIAEQKDLALAVREVIFATSKEEWRYVLRGIFFEVMENELRLTSADGFRLATTSVACRGLNPGSIIVPREVAKILPSLGEEILLRGNSICFAQGSRGNITFSTISGTFPQYQKLIPQLPLVNQLKISDTKTLISFLNSKAKRLRIVPLDGEVEFILFEEMGGSEEVGRLKVKAEAKGDGKTALDPRFLLDIVKITPTLQMAWDTPSTPVRIDAKRGVHVVMPIFEGTW